MARHLALVVSLVLLLCGRDARDLLFGAGTTRYGGEDVPGLMLDIVRYNAGASSGAPAGGELMQASPWIPRFEQLDAYWLDWGRADAPPPPPLPVRRRHVLAQQIQEQPSQPSLVGLAVRAERHAEPLATPPI
jgi:hypothetical protein